MQTTFAEVLETIEEFSIDEKETLIDILQNRLRENKRQRIVQSVKEARREFEKGNVKTSSVDEIMKEILS
ncbi:hypothetical protein BH20ACI1_BH20ACI1_24960 [soil metagenome]